MREALDVSEMKRMNIGKLIKERVPVLRWLPSYNTKDALGDFVAGLTVGLTLIPQSIAYASLAGLGPQYGLYSALIGSLIYIIFGTCKEVNIGPTALISLMTFTYTRGQPDYVVLLCFLSGCVTLLFGILHLGFLVEFVSTPVVSGFTSATSLIIASSQIKGLLGVSTSGDTFLIIWKELFKKLPETRRNDFILSCCCIVTLLSLRQIGTVKFQNKKLKSVVWFVGTSRNALVVLITSTVSWAFKCYDKTPFRLTGEIKAGLPIVSLPPFSTSGPGNSTVNFSDMVEHLGSGVFVVPMISILENVAIAKAFSRGRTLDATQEMFTLGLCNLIGSFFQSIPVTGSFSRSAVNNASGVRTPFGGLYTGVLVVLSLSLLTPYFYYIPTSTLSSVIICAVIFMVDVETVLHIWRYCKRDLVPTFTTFFVSLFISVELGIFIGIAIDMALLVFFNARPRIRTEQVVVGKSSYLLVTPTAGLLFPAIDYLRTKMTNFSSKYQDDDCNLVLDCRHITRIDFTAISGLSAVIKDLALQSHHVILLNASKEMIRGIVELTKDAPPRVAQSDLDIANALREISIKNEKFSSQLEIIESVKATADDEFAVTNL